tara:strand:- start:358 stop:735 length:378 start_codon:yes stop_codon:yes gene_type:complete
MPPVIGRLKRRSDFLRVAAARRKSVTPSLILQAMVHEPLPSGKSTEKNMSIRVGYTASKRVGGAVERNRARRRLRAAVAKVIPEYAKPGYDLVLVARKGTLARPFPKLLDDLVKSLKRLKAYRSV